MNLDELILGKSTRQAIDSFAAQPSHAVLLFAPEGSGKLALARALASKIMGVEPQVLDQQPYIKLIQPDTGKTTISIDAIREIHQFTKLKTIGSQEYRRIVIIADAQTMTTEAQNALLKLLEEPPADTVMILTAAPSDTLLSTIISRATTIKLQMPSLEECSKYFAGQGFDEAEIKRTHILSGGRIGLMHSLLTDSQDHPLINSVNQAKKLVSMSAFERMAAVNGLAKDKQQIQELLRSMGLVFRSLLIGAINKGQESQIRKFHQILSDIYELQEFSGRNPNSKLLLTDLMWKI